MKTEFRYKNKLTTESCFHLHKILDSVTKDENKYVTISGTVKDKSDKRALSYANVSIDDFLKSSASNDFCFFFHSFIESKFM